MSRNRVGHHWSKASTASTTIRFSESCWEPNLKASQTHAGSTPYNDLKTSFSIL
uniref:Uncharacterized protein n=1 Tax=Anguilla anguilla TaxID=7936 RepID=A0A0E9Q1I3_ANGAN